jgi:hypothetical protein
MVNALHKNATIAEGIHIIHNWEFASIAARDAYAYQASDVGKVCKVGTSWYVVSSTAPSFIEIGGGGGTTINSGITELNFGTGEDNLVVTITGQAGITASSKIKAWISGTGTTDHSSDEHAILSPYFQCITRNIVNGVGFDIVAVSQVKVSGRINVQWEWYN